MDVIDFTLDDVYNEIVPESKKQTNHIQIEVPHDWTPDPVWATLHPSEAAQVLDAMSRVIKLARASTNSTTLLSEQEQKDRERRAYDHGMKTATDAAALAMGHLSAQSSKLDEHIQLGTRILATIEKAFGKAGTTKDKGTAGESLVESWITEMFPDAALSSLAATPHAMDILLEFPDGFRILIEVKNKDRVDKKDVDKFESDVKTNSHEVGAAILLSLRTKLIPMRGQFQMAKLGPTTVVYMTDELPLNGKGLALAIRMLRSMAAKGLTDVTSTQETLSQLLHAQRDIHTRMQKMQKHTAALQDEQAACLTAIATSLTSMEAIAPAAITPISGQKLRKRK